MKVIPFTIPVARDRSIIIQEETLPFFYEHLHRHKEMQLTLVKEGMGTLIAGDYMQPFAAGEIYLVGAQQPHVFKSDAAYFRRGSRKKAQALTLFFDADEIQRTLGQLPEFRACQQLLRTARQGIRIPAGKAGLVAGAMQQVKDSRQAYRLSAFIQLLQAIADIRHLPVLSSDNAISAFTEKEGLRMNEVYRYTLAHYHRDISLEEIAAVACMTPQAFCRYFKKHTRKTFVSFLQEVRVAAASKKIISGSFESIAGVGYEAGFSSAIHFNRVFKKITGKSPGQYYREYRETV